MRRALLWGHDQAVLEFVAARSTLERPEWRGVAAAIGILRGDGGLIGGVVFSDWRPNFATCELSVVGASSLLVSTQMVRELGAFAFGQLDCYRIFARTSVRNRRAELALKALGFKMEGTKVHHYGRGHHASDWRVIRPEWEARWSQEAQQKAA